jgi:GDP/UDP-N,N'-diacetylbacillosamine 2-epimerase (hydrolysing)
MIVEFCGRHANASYFESLGQQTYLSCVKECDGIIGNSSSGLIEVPSLKKGTINIGKRQAGRICASSVISCRGLVGDIHRSMQLLLSDEFQNTLGDTINPYGEGCPSEKIVTILEGLNLQEHRIKHFVDFFESKGL